MIELQCPKCRWNIQTPLGPSSDCRKILELTDGDRRAMRFGCCPGFVRFHECSECRNFKKNPSMPGGGRCEWLLPDDPPYDCVHFLEGFYPEVVQ